MDNLPVTVELTLGEVNRLLVLLAERPLKEVHDLYLKVRLQGDAAVQLAQARSVAGSTASGAEPQA